MGGSWDQLPHRGLSRIRGSSGECACSLVGITGLCPAAVGAGKQAATGGGGPCPGPRVGGGVYINLVGCILTLVRQEVGQHQNTQNTTNHKRRDDELVCFRLCRIIKM